MLKYDFIKKKKLFDIFFCKTLKIKDPKKAKSSITNCDEWDSINHLNIIFKLESIFNCKLSNKEIKNLTNYKKLITCAKKKINCK